MSLRRPVAPDHQPVTRFHPSSFLGQPWSSSVPVLALEAQLPTGCSTTAYSAKAQVQSRRSKRWETLALPAKWPTERYRETPRAAILVFQAHSREHGPSGERDAEAVDGER